MCRFNIIPLSFIAFLDGYLKWLEAFYTRKNVILDVKRKQLLERINHVRQILQSLAKCLEHNPIFWISILVCRDCTIFTFTCLMHLWKRGPTMYRNNIRIIIHLFNFMLLLLNHLKHPLFCLSVVVNTKLQKVGKNKLYIVCKWKLRNCAA